MTGDHFTPFGGRVPAPILIPAVKPRLSARTLLVLWGISYIIAIGAVGNLAVSTWSGLKAEDRRIEIAARV